MNSKKYCLSTALEYSGKSNIEEWVHDFLCNEGKNVPFSEGLKLFDRYYYGPIKLPFNILNRCSGPEKNLKYVADKEWFTHCVSQMIEDINGGWDVPPLIVNFDNGYFEVNDGNHRYEALKKCGYDEYYSIIWMTEEKDNNMFLAEYKEYI